MEKAKMERRSELTRISRERPLTDAETEERELLRAEYLRDFRASMTGILDNSVIVRPDGSRERVSERKKSPDGSAHAAKAAEAAEEGGATAPEKPHEDSTEKSNEDSPEDSKKEGRNQ